MAGNGAYFYNILILASFYTEMYIISSIVEILLTTFRNLYLLTVFTTPRYRHGEHEHGVLYDLADSWSLNSMFILIFTLHF